MTYQINDSKSNSSRFIVMLFPLLVSFLFISNSQLAFFPLTIITTIMNKDSEEVGGMGDELDGISLRDVSAMRYIRHQQWLDQIVGNNTPTSKLIKVHPGLFDETTKADEWRFSTVKDMKKKLDQLKNEIKELESPTPTEESIETEKARKLAKKYREDVAKLRETFGTDDMPADQVTQDIEKEFGVSLIDHQRVRRVNVDLKLPQFSTAPEPSADLDASAALSQFDNDMQDMTMHLGDDAVMNDL